MYKAFRSKLIWNRWAASFAIRISIALIIAWVFGMVSYGSDTAAIELAKGEPEIMTAASYDAYCEAGFDIAGQESCEESEELEEEDIDYEEANTEVDQYFVGIVEFEDEDIQYVYYDQDTGVD